MATHFNLKLVKEYPKAISDKFDVRLYRTDIPGSKKHRFHFGFPVAMVSPLSVALESAVGWGERHWKKQDGFWLWVLPIIGKQPPRKELNAELRRMLRKHNRAANLSKQFVESNAQ